MSEKEPFTTDKETDITALVSRTGDKIVPMRIASPEQRSEDGKRYAYDAEGYKTVDDEKLGDDHQQQLARELADLPLRGDNVVVKRNGQFIEGTIDEYMTITSKTGTYKYGELVDSVGNHVQVPVSELSVDVQAEMDEAAHKKYLFAAKELIKNAKDLDASDKRELLDAFIANIDRAIARGDIKNSNGDSYSPDTMKNQLRGVAELAGGFQDPAKKAGNFVMNHVPHSDGLREAFKGLMGNELTSETFEQALKAAYGQDKTLDSGEEQKGQEPERKPSDIQNDNIQEYVKDLPDKEKLALWRYATASYPIDESDALNDMSQSTKDKRMHLEYKRMFDELQRLRKLES